MARFSLLLLSGTLAGCSALTPSASLDPQAAWRRVQLERLLARSAAEPAPAGHALAGNPPPAAASDAPQEPRRHLDQQEPPLPLGERGYAPPPADLSVGVVGGVGSVAFRAPGSRLDDRAPAARVQVHIDLEPDAAEGSGLWLVAASTDSSLFRGTLINDGIEPQQADASWRDYGLFPHSRWRTRFGERLQVDWRLGLDFDFAAVEHRFAEVERRWWSLGPRFVAEPKWRLLGSADRRLDLVGRFGVTVAATHFSESTLLGSDAAVTGRWSGTAGLGLRYRVGPLTAELGYEWSPSGYLPTDTEVFGDRSVRMSQQWLQLGLQVGF
jgi:hypothetical protein